MIWLGGSWRSWMMYSPRSVSTGTMPLASRNGLSAISSVTMDFALGHGLRALVAQDGEHCRARFARVARPMHLAAARATTLASKVVSSSSRCVTAYSRIARLASRRPSKSPKARVRRRASGAEMRLEPAECRLQQRVGQRGARRVGKRRHVSPSAGSPPMSASTSAAWRTLSATSLALHPPGQMQQAAEIAADQRVGTGGRCVGDLVVGHALGDVGIFHAEQSAEATAHLAVGQLADCQTFDGREQGVRGSSFTPISRSEEQES